MKSGEPITLDDLMTVATARRLRVTAVLTRTLSCTVEVDANDLSQWDEITALYGEYVVREVSPDGDALRISLGGRRPARRNEGEEANP